MGFNSGFKGLKYYVLLNILNLTFDDDDDDVRGALINRASE